jgi:DNA-directed RNA polymerase subunit RPC12/RpoP
MKTFHSLATRIREQVVELAHCHTFSRCCIEKSNVPGYSLITQQTAPISLQRRLKSHKLQTKRRQPEFKSMPSSTAAKCPHCGAVVPRTRLQKHISIAHRPAELRVFRKAIRRQRSKRPVPPLGQPQIIHPSDFAECPQCGTRLLKKVLRDHMAFACENRGIAPPPGPRAKRSPPWTGPSYEGHWKPW